MSSLFVDFISDLSVSTADAGSWFGGYSMREGRATATISVLSDLWSGEAHTTVLASADEAMDLFGRRLAISFMLQPNIAADLFYTELMRSQGFLSRCLPSFPPTAIGTRLYQAPGDTPALASFWAALDKLLLKAPDMDLETGELQPEVLQLTDKARELWIATHDDVERSQAAGREFEALRDVANKMAEQALRLAGVRAALENESQVSVDSMRGGIQLMQYYLAEWASLAGKLQAHKTEIAEPRQLWEWMDRRRSEKGQTSFTLREVYKNGPRFIRNQSQKARELIAELLRRGYVRVQGTGYEIRPADAL